MPRFRHNKEYQERRDNPLIDQYYESDIPDEPEYYEQDDWELDENVEAILDVHFDLSRDNYSH